MYFIVVCIFFVIANVLNASKIYVFGDSHSSVFSKNMESKVKTTNAVTMHRVGRDGFGFLYLPQEGVVEGDIVIFIFGEVDVRCHIGKQRDLYNYSVDDVIAVLAKNYLNAIVKNKLLYNKLTCVICSVTPPTNCVLNEEYPWYGSLEDRISITRKLNAKLAELCEVENILFLDIYDEYANSDGSLNADLSDGNVHIRSDCNEVIVNKFNEIINCRVLGPFD